MQYEGAKAKVSRKIHTQIPEVQHPATLRARASIASPTRSSILQKLRQRLANRYARKQFVCWTSSVEYRLVHDLP